MTESAYFFVCKVCVQAAAEVIHKVFRVFQPHFATVASNSSVETKTNSLLISFWRAV